MKTRSTIGMWAAALLTSASHAASLTGTLIYSSEAGGADAAVHAVDGDISTYYTSQPSAASDQWIGLDFGSLKDVSAVVYCPRSDRRWRLINAVVEVACQADFSDAKVGGILPATEAGIPFVLTTNVFSAPLVGRYARIRKNSSDDYLSLAEIAFEGEAHTLPPPLAGTLICSPYVNGPENAADGNLTTSYNSQNLAGDIHIGYDFGSKKFVSCVTYCPRSDRIHRLTNAVIEVACQSDFSDARVGCVLPPKEAQIPFSLTTVMFDSPLPGRYARLRTDPADNWFSIAELNFGGIDYYDIETSQVSNLTVSCATRLTGGNPTVSWTDVTSGNLGTIVYRATAAGGPWTQMTTLAPGQTQWLDETGAMGIRYYYNVAYVQGSGEQAVVGPLPETSVAYRRIHRLERDPADNTKLKSGMRKVISNAGNESVSKWKSDNAFDGDVTTAMSCPVPDTRLAVVSDNGKFGVEVVRAHSCVEGDRYSRLQTMRVYATDGGYLDDNPPVSVGGLPFSKDWAQVECDDPKCWRVYYMMRPDHSNFYCCFSELELYGWLASEESDVLIAPTRLTWSASAGCVTMSWDACNRAARYRVEKRVNGVWTELATVTATTYADAAATLNAKAEYRIVSLPAEGDETAFSQVFAFVPYLPADGTGLTGVYTWQYVLGGWTADEESAAVTNLDANLDFDWQKVVMNPQWSSDKTYNCRARWYGKLVVPVTGEYAFRADTAAGCSLGVAIDGNWAVNDVNVPEGGVPTGKLTLTAGEHDFYAELMREVVSAKFVLRWSGPVAEEVIPASQFKPTAPHVFDGWTSERSVSLQNTRLPNLAKAFPQTDGSVLFNRGRKAFTDIPRRYHALRREIKNDFTFSCHLKVEAEADRRPLGQRFALCLSSSADPKAPTLIAQVGWSATNGGTGAHRSAKCTTYGGTDYVWGDWANVGTVFLADGEGDLLLRRVGGDVEAFYRNVNTGDWVSFAHFTDTDAFLGSRVTLSLAAFDSANSTQDVKWRVSDVVQTRIPRGLAIIVR